MKSGFKFLLGAGALMAAALPFKIKNEETPGEVEVQSLLYRVKYLKPAEGEAKGSVSVSLPGVSSAEDLGELVSGVKSGVETVLAKLGSSDLTVEDICDKAVGVAADVRERVSQVVSDVAAELDDEIEVELVYEEDEAEEAPVLETPVSDDADDFADGE